MECRRETAQKQEPQARAVVDAARQQQGQERQQERQAEDEGHSREARNFLRDEQRSNIDSRPLNSALDTHNGYGKSQVPARESEPSFMAGDGVWGVPDLADDAAPPSTSSAANGGGSGRGAVDALFGAFDAEFESGHASESERALKPPPRGSSAARWGITAEPERAPRRARARR